MRDHPGHRVMRRRNVREVRSDSALPAAGMTTLAILLPEKAEPGESGGGQLLPGSDLWGLWGRSSCLRLGGRRLDRRDGKSGPGDYREENGGEREDSFADPHHRSAIDKRNREEKQDRQSRQHGAADHLHRSLEKLEQLEEEQE